MDKKIEDAATDSDSSTKSTTANFDKNEVAGCSQFAMHPSCPLKHQQGCMLWAPEPRTLDNEQPGCSSWTQQPRPWNEIVPSWNEDEMSSDDEEGEYESNTVSQEELDELMEEAGNPLEIEELTALRQTLDVMQQQRTPPGSDEDSDDYIYTSDSTKLRLQRYVDQRNTLTNDPDWTDDQSVYLFTGSEDTSGGEKDDSGLLDEEND